MAQKQTATFTADKIALDVFLVLVQSKVGGYKPEHLAQLAYDFAEAFVAEPERRQRELEAKELAEYEAAEAAEQVESATEAGAFALAGS